MVLNSEAAMVEGAAAGVLAANESSDTIVDRRLPVEGKPRFNARGRGRNDRISKSMADASTEDDGAVEAISESFASSWGASSTEVVSRRGEDMERLFVGECWLLFAPRRLSVGVEVSDTSLSLLGVGVAVVSSDS
jgi:hypothetical protein